eukprot:TRINITY_DN26789_c0_g1_i8.p1 TRINITY_DN26789_c0_g1~~TRINITY_DN26789_c0_g1_i8.p1  ORF type:complete len:290 (-),score=55.41 TRINITY_DN26789_c0_g1_i8:817-1686(-)
MAFLVTANDVRYPVIPPLTSKGLRAAIRDVLVQTNAELCLLPSVPEAEALSLKHLPAPDWAKEVLHNKSQVERSAQAPDQEPTQAEEIARLLHGQQRRVPVQDESKEAEENVAVTVVSRSPADLARKKVEDKLWHEFKQEFNLQVSIWQSRAITRAAAERAKGHTDAVVQLTKPQKDAKTDMDEAFQAMVREQRDRATSLLKKHISATNGDSSAELFSMRMLEMMKAIIGNMTVLRPYAATDKQALQNIEAASFGQSRLRVLDKVLQRAVSTTQGGQAMVCVYLEGFVC